MTTFYLGHARTCPPVVIPRSQARAVYEKVIHSRDPEATLRKLSEADLYLYYLATRITGMRGSSTIKLVSPRWPRTAHYRGGAGGIATVPRPVRTIRNPFGSCSAKFRRVVPAGPLPAAGWLLLNADAMYGKVRATIARCSSLMSLTPLTPSLRPEAPAAVPGLKPACLRPRVNGLLRRGARPCAPPAPTSAASASPWRLPVPSPCR